MAHEDIAPLHEKAVTCFCWLVEAFCRWRGGGVASATFVDAVAAV